jgi:hypothetical protein
MKVYLSLYCLFKIFYSTHSILKFLYIDTKKIVNMYFEELKYDFV